MLNCRVWCPSYSTYSQRSRSNAEKTIELSNLPSQNNLIWFWCISTRVLNQEKLDLVAGLWGRFPSHPRSFFSSCSWFNTLVDNYDLDKCESPQTWCLDTIPYTRCHSIGCQFYCYCYWCRNSLRKYFQKSALSFKMVKLKKRLNFSSQVPCRKRSIGIIHQCHWNIKPREDTCKCTWNVLFIIFENIYNYLRQKEKVTNRIDLQLASIFKMLHK